MDAGGWLGSSGTFEMAASGFDRAASAAGSVHVDEYTIAGSRLSLRFAGPALRERLTPAFAHLSAPHDGGPEGSSLTVHLWDSASTGTPPPSLPHVEADQPAGALYHVHEPPLRGAYQPGLESLSLFDSKECMAWYWVGNVYEQPSWDQACPIRQILFWWLGSRGYLQVHGGAVGTSTSGVLVVGQAGSGKSTVALACLGSELLYAGDDYVAVTLAPSPQVASLYSSAKLEPEHVHRFMPHLLPMLANADRLDAEKAILYVRDHFPDSTTAGFPLRAMIVPTLDAKRRRPRIVPTSQATAFAALAPSTIFQLHTAGADELATMSALVARLPCYRLELGSDLTAIPVEVARLLSELRYEVDG
jgi:hypothetical protein